MFRFWFISTSYNKFWALYYLLPGKRIRDLIISVHLIRRISMMAVRYKDVKNTEELIFFSQHIPNVLVSYSVFFRKLNFCEKASVIWAWLLQSNGKFMLMLSEASNPWSNSTNADFKILPFSFVHTFHITFNFVSLACFFLSFSYQIRELTITQQVIKVCPTGF